MQNSPRRAEFGWPGGDRPGELAFRVAVPAEVGDAIIALVARVLPEFAQRAEIHALTQPDGAIGRYRVATPHAACFVRVSARLGYSDLEQEITGWLKAHDVAVNHLEFAGMSLSHDGEELRLDVRELLDARHDDGSLKDLRRLSVALRNTHRHLREFPRSHEVREYAKKRFAHLETIREYLRRSLFEKDWEAIADDPDWARVNADWLGDMVENFVPRFDTMPGAQCLHAQVHRANVLFRRVDGAPVLLDFEEAVQTFAPISWDMAYFVQRFCLADAYESDVLLERFKTIRTAYAAPISRLAMMMRQTAWFSMSVLVDYHLRGIVSPRSEYEKFVRLENQARSLAPMLHAAFDA